MEVWKGVPGYEKYYQVSNLGRVKNLSVDVFDKNGNLHYVKKESIRKINMKQKYKFVSFNVNGETKKFYVHQLVAMAFMNHVPDKLNKVVDHIDGNPENNKLENLQILSHSDNILKGKARKHVTSKYKGVCYDKSRDKYIVHFKNKFVGRFKSEIDAMLKYEQVKSLYVNSKGIKL